jgi:transposase
MATLVKLRPLTSDERKEFERLGRSRTEEARLVQRARIFLGLAAGERPYQVTDRVGVGRAAAYEWLHRFNAEGLKGLTDPPRPGRRPTYTPEQRAEVIAAALTDPQALGLSFASWTLDRLQAYPSAWTASARTNAGSDSATACIRSSTPLSSPPGSHLPACLSGLSPLRFCRPPWRARCKVCGRGTSPQPVVT